MSDYFIINKFEMAISYIFTKIFFPKARLVRRPVYIRGKKGIVYQKGLTTGHGCRFDASNTKETLFIGKDARFGDYVHINANEKVVIGDNILTASKVFISDTSHGCYKGEIQTDPRTNPSMREDWCAPVMIGDNVWIGENVVILPGCEIGNGCIIGANSLLNGGKYPDNCMIVGTPGRIVKKYNCESKKWEVMK